MEKLDFILNKMLPKKLIVWLTFFICFLSGRVDSQMFTNVTIAYITANLLSKWVPYISNKITNK